ncbi:MAG: phosphoribosylaminoimidazolesuccinocarboxamide synthase, partial [Actinobacteria bacterium]|nr:phosphoribosylaminoimidazolesuccinocarboxamide synthase [Actinomycetota bacterium]NIS31961.1 phosphoribosylaminoimidazolesuccinocarboxamide synthase [Actinomycetota bacterium]NIT97920.1 phosphoribosylaminoimidazolesuccinocarboxamide synthase [Actinomycetota bacterium]NIU21564.1 phosphoribosylaminoimidazolesuccinocarboxamide synthase [Actinomycetota bacterium]NIU67044.1 phosphoribosylaminoimidazolesuccinocarboxamide synthase [Actinomycetota bacterium]
GAPMPSFDKQFVRDALDAMGWDHDPPAPHLDPEVITETRAKYVEAFERLTGRSFEAHLKEVGAV